MKRKIFLVILVLILTITNFILLKKFYNTEIKSNNEIILKENKNIKT